VKTGTGLANQVRGLLAEHGIVIARGFAPLRRALPSLLEDRDNGLSAVMRELLGESSERLRFIDERLRKYDLTIQRLFRHDERCQRLAEVEGVDPLTATALVAVVGNATEFRSGRELAAYLGLVPRHSRQRRAHGAAGDQQTWRSLLAHHSLLGRRKLSLP
jgi:transposase